MSSIEPMVVQGKTGVEVLVRSAEVGDANAILEIMDGIRREGAFEISIPEGFRVSKNDEEAWSSDLLADPNQLLVVAEVEGRLAGLVHLGARSQERLAHSSQIAVAVHPDWRGKGIAQRMLIPALAWAEAHPILERVEQSVLGNNEHAIELYRKLGFVEEGRRRQGVKLGPESYTDDVLMCRFVRT